MKSEGLDAPNTLLATMTVTVSKALIDALHERTDAAVAEDGYDEFVEYWLRRGLRESDGSR